jgi:hypothetical protein
MVDFIVRQTKGIAMQLPSLKYNQKEIEEMSPEYFQYIVKCFWEEVKGTVTKEEFIALGTALAVRKVKENNLTPSKEKIKDLISSAME